MCYAIPGKVVGIRGRNVILEYFSETRNAVNEFFELSEGDYVYAQGGLIVEQIDRIEAERLLSSWKNKFMELKRIDSELSKPPAALEELLDRSLNKEDLIQMLKSNDDRIFAMANALRSARKQNSCCVHGIIEFSNYCINDCKYCGIRKSNRKLVRCRMSKTQLFRNVEYAIKKLGFKAIVLQSGEDEHYTDEMFSEIVEEIAKRFNALIFISCGTRTESFYKKAYDAGARGVLLRFETSNEDLYNSMHPAGSKGSLKERLHMIKYAKKLGYICATGFMVGLPGQTIEDIANDIIMTRNLDADMYSIGPFIPHAETPLRNSKQQNADLWYRTIATARIAHPDANILVTTALETIDKDGLRKGMMCGANSFMINATPDEFAGNYDIYPRDVNLIKSINSKIEVIKSIGRAPTDISI